MKYPRAMQCCREMVAIWGALTLTPVDNTGNSECGKSRQTDNSEQTQNKIKETNKDLERFHQDGAMLARWYWGEASSERFREVRSRGEIKEVKAVMHLPLTARRLGSVLYLGMSE